MLFREVNERIRSINATFGTLTGSYQILCECENLDCTRRLRVPAEAYEAAREAGARFFLLPAAEPTSDAGERT